MRFRLMSKIARFSSRQILHGTAVTLFPANESLRKLFVQNTWILLSKEASWFADKSKLSLKKLRELMIDKEIKVASKYNLSM